MKDEIYVSTDIEADGPIPGPNSMLSFASAAYLPDKTLVGTFSANLNLLPEATPDPKTMEFWKQHPEAWQAARSDCREPREALTSYVAWLTFLEAIPFVLWIRMRKGPAAVDYIGRGWRRGIIGGLGDTRCDMRPRHKGGIPDQRNTSKRHSRGFKIIDRLQ